MTRTSALFLAFTVALPLAAQQPGPGANVSNPTAPAKSAKPAGPPAPQADSEMQQLKFFVGTWACKGRTETTSMGPAHDTTGSVHIALDFAGFWVIGRYDEAKSAANPMPMRFEFVWGHDAKEKKFQAWGFDTFGGAAKQTSAGWDGDKMIWTGESAMGGQQVGVRDTFVKKGEAITHMGEMQMNGQWTKTDEESCSRSTVRK
jgi:hypothetical protein